MPAFIKAFRHTYVGRLKHQKVPMVVQITIKHLHISGHKKVSIEQNGFNPFYSVSIVKQQANMG